MTISFDLDDTLIPSTKLFDTERQNFLQKLFRTEKIRSGTIELIKELQQQGHNIYIYTTSYRSTYKIWWTFFSHGIKIDKIINQHIHNKVLGKNSKGYSKYPPAFNIDVHVDDSAGVKIEGERHNFRTIIVTENNSWKDVIKQTIFSDRKTDKF